MTEQSVSPERCPKCDVLWGSSHVWSSHVPTLERSHHLLRGKHEPEQSVDLRVRVVDDPDPDLSWLDQDEFAGVAADDLATLGVIVESRCKCCGHWDQATSLWGITVTGYPNADEGLRSIDVPATLTTDEARAIPGYIGTIVADLLAEVAAR